MSTFMVPIATANGSISSGSANVCPDVVSEHLLLAPYLTSYEGQNRSHARRHRRSYHYRAENSPLRVTPLFFEVKHSTPLPRSLKSHTRRHSSRTPVSGKADAGLKAQRRHSYSDASIVTNWSSMWSLGSTIHGSCVFVDAEADDMASKICYRQPIDGKTKHHWESGEFGLVTATDDLFDDEGECLKVGVRGVRDVTLRQTATQSIGLMNDESFRKYGVEQQTRQSASRQQCLSHLLDALLISGDNTGSDSRQLPTDRYLLPVRLRSYGGCVDEKAVDGLQCNY